MDVRLLDAGAGDLHEARLRAHLFDVPAAGVTHARPQAANHLMDDRRHRPLERHAAFDTFRHQLFDFGGGVLEVAILGTVGTAHRAHRTHAAIGLVRTRSEEHTSELQSLMRISYAVFCWKKKN